MSSRFTLRRAEDRGRGEHGWLHSRHSFSFAGYYDPHHMGFRALRVINEDRVAPGHGFGTHPHREMEILSYVVEGALEHADSMGTGSVIVPGEVQRMSAGTGVTHSEYNHSKEKGVHFLQIWIEPEQRGLRPSYEQRAFSEQERKNTLRLLAARDGRDGAITIHQDVELYGGLLDAGAKVERPLEPGRHAWLQVVKGAVLLDGERLEAGDGAQTSEPGLIALEALEDAEVLLFDLA